MRNVARVNLRECKSSEISGVGKLKETNAQPVLLFVMLRLVGWVTAFHTLQWGFARSAGRAVGDGNGSPWFHVDCRIH